MYDKRSGVYNSFAEANIVNDIDHGITGKILYFDDNKFIMLIEPYKLLEHIEQPQSEFEISEDSKKLFHRLVIRGGGGNPILMIGKLKK